MKPNFETPRNSVKDQGLENPGLCTIGSLFRLDFSSQQAASEESGSRLPQSKVLRTFVRRSPWNAAACCRFWGQIALLSD